MKALGIGALESHPHGPRRRSDRGIRRARSWVLGAMASGVVAAIVAAPSQVALGGEPQATPAGEASYLLAPQDKLKMRVMEWRPAANDFREWTPLTYEYVVDASGFLYVPLIGSVQARGLSISRLAVEIAERLKNHVGLSKPPDVTIEIVAYRPIYIVGDVQQRGEFTYRPGLTAVKAMALAGGTFRDPTTAGAMARERISSEQALEQAQLELQRTLVRRSRLNAELALVQTDAVSQFAFSRPPELTVADNIEKLMLDEERIMSSRMSGYKSQQQSFLALKDLLQKEDETLVDKMKSLNQQLTSARAQRDNIEDLWKKNLVVATTRMQVEAALAQLEGRMLDLETTKLRVQQDLSKTGQKVEDARSELLAKVTTELQEAESKIDLLRNAITKQHAMLRVNLQATAAAASLENKANVQISYTIKRSAGLDSPPVEIAAKSDTPIQPGDVLLVAMEATAPASEPSDFIGTWYSSNPKAPLKDSRLDKSNPRSPEDHSALRFSGFAGWSK